MSLYPSITCTHHNPGGINKMNVVTFVVLSLLGTTIWNFALILLGRMLSGSFDALMGGFTHILIHYVRDYYSCSSLRAL